MFSPERVRLAVAVSGWGLSLPEERSDCLRESWGWDFDSDEAFLHGQSFDPE
jgi:hypothetical protein